MTHKTENARDIKLTRLSDEQANRYLSVIYTELKRIAAAYMRKERTGHTLQPTALLHEALLKLDAPSEQFVKSDAEFFAAASSAMRRVLVDHARRKNAEKRGGQMIRIALEHADIPAATVPAIDLLDLDAAIDDLRELNQRHAQVVQLRFFAGLNVQETASVLHVSTATVKKDWRLARAWLLSRLDGQKPT